MQVGIVLGSRSQWSTMKHTAKLLADLGIHYEARIITANKNANKLHEYASKAINRGLEIIIAGANERAYIPGIIASKTEVPVLGIQINNSSRQKNTAAPTYDSRIKNPVGILNYGPEDAVTAALYAANIVAQNHPRVRENLDNYCNRNNAEY